MLVIVVPIFVVLIIFSPRTIGEYIAKISDRVKLELEKTKAHSP